MNKENKKKPTKQAQGKLSVAFQELAHQVKSEDIARAQIEMPTSDTTIWRYLKGDVAKQDFGLKLYQFLRKCVIMREQNIERAVA